MSSITSPQPTQENAANPAALPHAALVKIWGVSLVLLALFIPGLARADFGITSATVNGGSSVTVAPGETIDVAVTLDYFGNVNGANGEWESTRWTVNGVDTCNDHDDRHESGPDNVNFSITAPTTTGTHTLTLKPYSNDNCSGQTGSNFNLNNAITVQQPTPVADYRFDECSWTSGTSGAVSDSAGSYHGTPYSTNTVSGGVVNRAADLSATGTSDYIHWPISLLNGRTNFTISLWFKTSVNKSQQDILHGLGSGSGDDEIEIYLINSTGVRVNIRDDGNNYTAASSFANGAWHHLAVTKSGTSVCVYLDSTMLDCNTRSSNALSITNSNALLTGQEQDSFGGGFTSSQALEAQLDEFKVFAAALSASSISSIYANELAGNNWDGSARSNPCLTGPCETFRDEFSSNSYGRNDGTASWTGNWTEGGDNGSSSNGNIEIASNRLQFEGDADNNTSIYREANLSGYTSATLSFDYSESGWDSHDTLEVRVSANGGADWTTIHTFNNDQGAGGTFSQDITAYIAGNFRLAFVITSANGSDDEFYIDNVQIEACTTSSSLNHIRLEHDGDGLTCMPETITIKACADANCDSLYTAGSTSVTLSDTGWSSNPITFTGSTTVTLSKTAPQTVTMGTSAVSPSPAGVTRCYLGVTQDCNLIFSDAGFIFAATTGGTEVTIPVQTAGTASGTYYLRAVKTSTTTGACEAALVGANSVELAYECNDSATCYAADLMSVNGGTATTIARNNNGSVTSYTSTPMTFDANGNAPFTFNYGDAGRVTLHAKKTVNSVLLSDATNAFIVKPHNFLVIPCAASVVGACTAAPTDPGLVGGGSAFARAGEQFKATVTARTSTTPPTPTFSFGAGTNSATETVALTRNRLAPTGAGTADGALSGTTAIHRSDFSSGVATVSNLAWSEVGVISLTATNSAFLGNALTTTGTSGNIGRFIPDHFAITTGAVTEGCDTGNFTYFGQDGFATPFTLTAQNAAGGTTQNYTGNFAKLDLTLWNNYSFTATWLPAAPNPISTLLASATAPTGNWSNGIASVTAIHQASRPVSPVAAANITINAKPTDTDGVTIVSATPVQTAVTPLRYGRLVLKNAYGTEREALKMRLQAQYYNGSAFITNADDTCVSFSATALACTDANAADTLICTDVTASGPNVGNGQYFTLSAPNKTGPLLYTLTVAAWLQYEWDNAGNDYNENPFARANFGIYRGNDRIINWREIIR